MSGKIKGITIEIGGDSTKLDKALRESAQRSKDLQKELKGVNSLLKFDPKNTELLNQKQQLLTKSVAETKDRLNTLRDAQAQVTEQFEKGEIGEEAYRDFQREIVNTENKLKSLQKELKDFGSVGAQKIAAVGEQMKDVGGKIENAGKKMSAVSGGIAAVGGASVAAAMELDEGYDIIIQKTGATGKAFEDMKGIADSIFTSMPVEMTDVGSAVGEVNTRFNVTGDALEKLSTQFLQFAQNNNTDVSTSVDLVQKNLAAFGLSSDHAGEMLDVLNKVGQDTGISMDTLSGLITSNASTLKELGLNAYSSADFLGKLEKSGIDSTQVMSGLKIAMKNAAEDGKSLDEGLADLEKTMVNAKDSQDAMSAAVELFGAKAGPQLAVAIQDGTLSFQDLISESGNLENAVGSVSDTFEATLDPWDEAKTIVNDFKVSGSELAGELLTSLKPVLSDIKEDVKSFTTWFSELDDGTKNTIIKIAEVIAILGPVLTIIGKLASGVGSILQLAPTIVSVVGTVKTAASGLWAVLSANPIGIVIAVIAALVAAFVGLYKHNEKFRKFVDGIWAKIKSVFGSLPKWFSDKISNITNTVKSGLNKVKSFFSGLKLKLPNIKLPHFKLNGSFSLKPPSVPKLQIDWYAKAMEDGMILNAPTIFGMNSSGQFMGAGEVPGRSETVVGTDSLMDKIDTSVTNAMSKIKVGLYIDSRDFTRYVDTKLGTLQTAKGRGAI